MFELIGEMAICLIVAILLGFGIGWLFARAVAAEEYDLDYDEISIREDEYNSQLKTLQEKYNKEKDLAEECEKRNRELKGELMKKINLLQKTSDTLQEVQQKHGKDISSRVVELENLLKKKDEELMEFERVLVKAEETIEEFKRAKKD